MMTFPRPDSALPFLTVEQMREVDRAMVEDYGIQLPQMMENAGRALATLARQRFLDGEARGKRVLVVAGRGGNGGGGLAAARRLHAWGALVSVLLAAQASDFQGVPGMQLTILRKMDVTVEDSRADVSGHELIIDAVIGYSLAGAPRGRAATLLEAVNRSGTPALSLDVPSGLDATSGLAHDPCVTAAATLTLALPKTGLAAPGARTVVGELYLADIGVPPQLYAQPPLSLTVGPIFSRSDILRIW